uniref:Uncharacterized protein n=1 Tax=Setaria viridis TaxID=4556 RepID=A0A4U6TI89_SETVI|nr:hypothetical protein SEVIR_8G222200v2 [Setaria viridis]
MTSPRASPPRAAHLPPVLITFPPLERRWPRWPEPAAVLRPPPDCRDSPPTGLWVGLLHGLTCQACSLLAVTVRTKWSKLAEAMQEEKANYVA